MKVGYLITARLKSTRLPEKLLREVAGRPIFAHMLDRLKLVEQVDQIIVCTSTNPQDSRLIDLAVQEGVSYFCGDEDDVLRRLYNAMEAFDLDYALNITADCPFVDPEYADKIVEAYKQTDADLIRSFDLPHGAFSYGLKPAAVRQILEIKADTHTEVWGRYFTDTDLFTVYDLPITNSLHRQPGLRMTLDYPEDLAFFKAVFAALHQPGRVFSLDEILDFLAINPDVVAINSHCAAPFKKRWTKQSEITLKPRYLVNRAAIIGAGSIGQRHIRNLRALGIDEIVALRSRQGHFDELDPSLGVQEVTNWEDLLATRPDIAIISNPSSLHIETATRLLPHVRGLFIEKPLSHSWVGVPQFLEEAARYRAVTFVGYNLQFHPIVREIEALLSEERLGSPLLFQGQVGHWLPDWHPYEDYQQAYYARPELGGGVSLTLIHEVHLALTLLGGALQVTCLLPQSELLPLEVDTIADIMLQHQTGAVSQLHLDYIQKALHRSGVISCERGWIRYDFVQPQVMVQYAGEPKPQQVWETAAYDGNQPYLLEMETFLRYMREGRARHPFDVWQGAQGLAVVLAAHESARSGKLTEVVNL